MNAHYTIIFFLVIFSWACTSAEEPQQSLLKQPADNVSYIRTLHPPVPHGIEKIASALVEAPGQPADEVEFGLDHVRVGSVQLLWLSEMLGIDPDGVLRWCVIDEVEIPAMEQEEHFVIDDCSSDNHDMIAAIIDDQEVITRVRRAWRVDESSGQLVEIDTTGIRCQNAGLHAPDASS